MEDRKREREERVSGNKSQLIPSNGNGKWDGNQISAKKVKFREGPQPGVLLGQDSWDQHCFVIFFPKGLETWTFPFFLPQPPMP